MNREKRVYRRDQTPGDGDSGGGDASLILGKKNGRKSRETARHVRTAYLGILAAIAAVGLLLATTQRPAEAAFPGSSGAIAFFSDRDGSFQIYRMGADGFGATKLTGTMILDEGFNLYPEWSSDGEHIAFYSDRDNNDEVYFMNASGSGEINLTHSSAEDRHPSWFPHQNKIIFQSTRTGGGDLYALTFGAGGDTIKLTRLTTSAAADSEPSVSPDGQKIAFASSRDGDLEIFVMKANPEGPDNRPVKLTRNTAADEFPDWSPNGKKIAYESGDTASGPTDVFTMDSDGTNKRNLTETPGADGRPAYSPDGKKIAFQTVRGSVDEIWRMRTDGSNQKRIADAPGTLDAAPSWQPLP
jgi:Tol biopolymer transport system component